jgi:hypothetical protein
MGKGTVCCCRAQPSRAPSATGRGLRLCARLSRRLRPRRPTLSSSSSPLTQPTARLLLLPPLPHLHPLLLQLPPFLRPLHKPHPPWRPRPPHPRRVWRRGRRCCKPTPTSSTRRRLRLQPTLPQSLPPQQQDSAVAATGAAAAVALAEEGGP